MFEIEASFLIGRIIEGEKNRPDSKMHTESMMEFYVL